MAGGSAAGSAGGVVRPRSPSGSPWSARRRSRPPSCPGRRASGSWSRSRSRSAPGGPRGLGEVEAVDRQQAPVDGGPLAVRVDHPVDAPKKSAISKKPPGNCISYGITGSPAVPTVAPIGSRAAAASEAGAAVVGAVAVAAAPVAAALLRVIDWKPTCDCVGQRLQLGEQARRVGVHRDGLAEGDQLAVVAREALLGLLAGGGRRLGVDDLGSAGRPPAPRGRRPPRASAPGSGSRSRTASPRSATPIRIARSRGLHPPLHLQRWPRLRACGGGLGGLGRRRLGGRGRAGRRRGRPAGGAAAGRPVAGAAAAAGTGTASKATVISKRGDRGLGLAAVGVAGRGGRVAARRVDRLLLGQLRSSACRRG